MKYIPGFIRSLVWLALVCVGQAEPPDAAPPRDVPVAPIAPVSFEGWSNAYRLANAEITVILVPDIGRVMFLGPTDGKNLLRVDDALKGTLASDDQTTWRNFGGDWIWPVSQAHWAEFAKADWPPSRLIDGRPWKGHAWKNADGEACFRMSQTYGEPLNINVTRLFKVPPEGAMVTVEQQCERTAPSDYPVTLWNISQIAGATHAILPRNPDSAFTNGYRLMMGAPPGTNALVICGDQYVYITDRCPEIKLGLDSQPAWIAAAVANSLLIETMQETDSGASASYPDQGCTVEMYSNQGLGYTEIELLGQETNLTDGDILSNTLIWKITPYKAQPSAPPCSPAQATTMNDP